MIEVRLHGALAQQFGKRWDLDISTPAEAVRAIECARRGFKAAILKLGEAGFVFRVRSKNHDYCNEDVGATLGSVDRIDIIPVVRGASAGARFVVGLVMVIVGLATSWLGGAGVPVASAGFALMVGSVVEWLTPKPKKPESQEGMQSWTFNGPSNTTEQGVPVPVIYGEVLTGSIPVSAGVTVAESAGGYSENGVTIGGNLDMVGNFQNAGIHTMVFILSAAIVGSRQPTAYRWSYTGFANAVAARWVQTDAVAKLELDFNVSAGPGTSDIGTLRVEVDTYAYRTTTQTVTATASATVWYQAAA